MKGRLLWLEFNKAIILEMQMRQTNEHFRHMLIRISDGVPITSDFSTLEGRLVSKVITVDNSAEWYDTPVISSKNNMKDYINYKSVLSYAYRSRKVVHNYYTENFCSSELVSDPSLRDHLLQLHTGKTKSMGILSLGHGMKVVLTQNYDVLSGIVNNLEGVLKSVRYRTDKEGRRYTVSCVVKVNHLLAEAVPGLSTDEIVVLRESVYFVIYNPVTRESIKFVRKQLPM